jgi:CRP-like cAMP-binding protein
MMSSGKSTSEKIADEVLRASTHKDDGQESALDQTETHSFPVKIFEANQKIFDENDVAETAYILRSGAVDIRVGTLSDSPSVLTTIKVGDVFGELALLEERNHHAAAVTTERSEVLEIPRRDFLNRLGASDLVMKTVVVHLSRRLRETTTELEELRKSRWSG